MSGIDFSSNPSLNEIVSSLAARVNKQHDSGFMEELKHIVNYKRKKAIHVWIVRMNVKNFLFQTYMVGTERVSATECEAFPTNCYIVRTKCKVPNPFRSSSIKMPHELFDYVGDQSGYLAYTYIDREYLPLLRHKQYTSSAKKWFYSDGYIYIVNEKNATPPPVMIRGVFEDALSDKNCDACDTSGNTCEADDLPYAVPPELLDDIVQSIISVELRAGDIPKEIDQEKDEIKVDSAESIQHVNT